MSTDSTTTLPLTYAQFKQELTAHAMAVVSERLHLVLTSRKNRKIAQKTVDKPVKTCLHAPSWKFLHDPADQRGAVDMLRKQFSSDDFVAAVLAQVRLKG